MKRTNIEDIYRLSPLQEGMLFHTACAPDSGVYFRQLAWTLSRLDVEAFKSAWEQVVHRHPVFRTGFISDRGARPVQAVHREATLSWQYLDWSGLNHQEEESRLQEFLREDRRRGFDLSLPPLMRFTLIRLGPDRYQFIWSHHHLLVDGWTMPLVRREVTLLYEANQKGQQANLGSPRPYRDYIAWLEKQDIEQARQYWQAALAGVTEPVKVLPDTGCNGSSGTAYRELFLPLDTLRSFAKKNRLTLNTVVQAAWGLVVGRCSGQDDVVFGAVVSGRPAELQGVEEMLGPFINTLPVRIRLHPDTNVLEWMKSLQSQQLEARHYDYTALSQIQEWSEVRRGASLFDVALAFENFPVNDESLGSSKHSFQLLDARSFEQVHFPLTLAAEAGKKLCLSLHYDAAKFTQSTADRILHHMATVLEQLPSASSATLRGISLFSHAEAALLRQAGQSRTSCSENRPVHAVFEEQAAARPDQIAAQYGNDSITYRQLDRRANHLAARLVRAGVTSGDIIGVYLERSIDMLVALLGVLKAGAAYLPLDLTYPGERLQFMLSDAESRLLITGAQNSPASLHTDAQTLLLDDGLAESAPRIDVAPESAAYVMFTSGSTGRPKGISVPHRAITRLVRDSDYVRFGPDSVIAQASNCSFDAATMEIWGTLMNGGRLVGVSRDDLLSPANLAALIRTHGITTLFITTAVFHQIAAEAPETFYGLENLLTGGERMDPRAMRAVLHSRPPRRLLHVYGPTENTTFSTWKLVEQVEDGAASVPIGNSISSTDIYVIDTSGELAPIGAPGELWAGGAGLAHGYVGRPELTAEKFIPDPFSGKAGARLYRTGDRVRRLPDGSIDFLGRVDRQVKIRGFRIEVGEIEAAVSVHPGVKEIAVLAREDRAGIRKLVAYFVPSGIPGVSSAELRSFLKNRLPEYMVPSLWVVLEALPLNSNGKVDEKLLPEPHAESEHPEGAAVPVTEAEQTLLSIWKQVLGAERISMDANFFDLGGDSILSMQIAARAGRAGLRINPRLLFQYPTIRELAAKAEPATSKPVREAVVAGPATLTPVQLWFFEQELADPQHFNQSIIVEVPSGCDASALQQAFQRLVEQHDALRMRYHRDDQGWHQHVSSINDAPAPSLLQFHCDESVPERSKAVVEERCARLQASLHLQHGPLLRAALFSFGEVQPKWLFVTIHHLVVDVVSWSILLDDLATAYRQITANLPVRLGEKTTSFHRWGRMLADYAAGPVAQRELSYWLAPERKSIQALPVRGAGDQTEASAVHMAAELGKEETQVLLQEVCKSWKIAPHELALAAFAHTISRWTGDRRLLVDVEGHGREALFSEIDLSRTVGWFTSIAPVLLDLGPESSLVEQVKRVKEQLRAVPNGGIGYGILRYLGPYEIRREMLQHPRAEIVFNYMGKLDQTGKGDSLFRTVDAARGSVVSPRAKRRYLFEINGGVREGSLQFVWSYSPDLHRPAEMEKLRDDFIATLNEIAGRHSGLAAPVYTPSDFPDAGLTQSQLNSFLEQLQAMGEDS
jgi:amino acid adenylation domain-containing protein/non-ribosomal peptide synthase protein (TIGR01720 family)